MNLKNYVVSTEILQNNDMASSNISMAIKELIEGTDYIKQRGTILLNTKSLSIPQYIRSAMNNCTSLDGMIPYSYFKEELLNKMNSVEGKYEMYTIGDKKFVKITDKYLAKAFVNGSTRFIYKIDYKSTPEMLNEKYGKVRDILHPSEWVEVMNRYINGFLDLSKQTKLVWY